MFYTNKTLLRLVTPYTTIYVHPKFIWLTNVLEVRFCIKRFIWIHNISDVIFYAFLLTSFKCYQQRHCEMLNHRKCPVPRPTPSALGSWYHTWLSQSKILNFGVWTCYPCHPRRPGYDFKQISKKCFWIKKKHSDARKFYMNSCNKLFKNINC